MHSIGDVGLVQNRRLSFVPRNIFGRLGCLRASNRSGNTKRGSKGVSGCWENWDLLCLRSLPPILSHITIILSFLGNRRSHSSPVSIFRTDTTPLIACKGRKPSAAWIRDFDFRGRSLLVMLSIFSAIFDYLSNSKSFSSSVSWFWTDSTPVNNPESLKYSAARFRIAKFESRWRLYLRLESSIVNLST